MSEQSLLRQIHDLEKKIAQQEQQILALRFDAMKVCPKCHGHNWKMMMNDQETQAFHCTDCNFEISRPLT
ncbi:hypothetical protein ACQZV8_04195 [Magnetococcales bacterium HHB-1]